MHVRLGNISARLECRAIQRKRFGSVNSARRANAIPRIVTALFYAAAIFQSPNAWAASFEVSIDPKKTCSAIAIEGDIQVGDYDRFVVALRQAASLASLRRLYLNSGGGDLVTAVAIAEFIRNSAPTVEAIVESRHGCNSACVIILTAGTKSNVSVEAEVIVHQVFNQRTGKREAQFTRKVGQYLALNGLPPDVIWTMSNLGPDELLRVIASNAKRLGFGRLNFYGDSSPPATPQCSWDGFTLDR